MTRTRVELILFGLITFGLQSFAPTELRAGWKDYAKPVAEIQPTETNAHRTDENTAFSTDTYHIKNGKHRVHVYREGNNIRHVVTELDYKGETARVHLGPDGKILKYRTATQGYNPRQTPRENETGTMDISEEHHPQLQRKIRKGAVKETLDRIFSKHGDIGEKPVDRNAFKRGEHHDIGEMPVDKNALRQLREKLAQEKKSHKN